MEKLYEEVNTMLSRIEKSREELKIAAISFETQSGMLITDENQKNFTCKIKLLQNINWI